MLGIIGAMDVEVNSIKETLYRPTVRAVAGVDFYSGTVEGVPVCVAQCHPGKVNAALCTQAMLDCFDVHAVINIGVGCSLADNVVIRHVVVADGVCQYDIDITALGEPRGLINGLNTVSIKTDAALSEQLARAAARCGNTVHRGCVASGDTFIASAEMKADLAAAFDAICGEMEGGAIGHVCAANGVPFAVLRTVSDGGNEAAALDYPTFKPIAADISTRILMEYIKSQPRIQR